MESRIRRNTVAILLLVVAAMIVWPTPSSAQITRRETPSDSQQPKPQPASPDTGAGQRPAEPASEPALPPPSSVVPIVPSLERTPGLPDKRTEILVRVRAVSEETPNPAETGERTHGTVEIYKGSFPSNAYKVVIYRKEGEAVRDFSAFVGGTRPFDCAYYRWKDDTTVIVRLYNTATQQEARYEISGRGGWTSLKVTSDY